MALLPPSVAPNTCLKRAMLPADVLDPATAVPYEVPYLPTYSPSLQVDLHLPTPPILRIGEPIMTGLSITTTENLMTRLGAIYLRSLEIRLKSHTAFRSGPASRTASCIISLYSAVRDGNDIKLPVYETPGTYFLEGNQWQLPVIPQIPVSFSYGEFSRRYTLEVLAGFSGQRQRAIEVCVTIRDQKTSGCLLFTEVIWVQETLTWNPVCRLDLKCTRGLLCGSTTRILDNSI